MPTKLPQRTASLLVCLLFTTQTLSTRSAFAQGASDFMSPMQQSVEVPISSSTKSAEIRFVLLEPVSSATAVLGQRVRFAVDQDVTVNGTVVIPRGTLATGVVSHVGKAIPSKRDGYVTFEAAHDLSC